MSHGELQRTLDNCRRLERSAADHRAASVISSAAARYHEFRAAQARAEAEALRVVARVLVTRAREAQLNAWLCHGDAQVRTFVIEHLESNGCALP
jgi:hypothetical protein